MVSTCVRGMRLTARRVLGAFIEEFIMFDRELSFDLNDIHHEPSDEQLEMLMKAVAEIARQRAQAARERLMARLQAEISALHASQPSV
jgi:hypothetical protein